MCFAPGAPPANSLLACCLIECTKDRSFRSNLQTVCDDKIGHMASNVTQVFLDYSSRRLDETASSISFCLGKLSDEQIWQRSGEHENAIGNLILHLCGNARQWIMHGVGGADDVRQRELEFSTRGGSSRDQLLALFHETIEEARHVIAHVTPERIVEITHPQGRTVHVMEAIYQVVGHVQQHAGQIILLTKQMTGRDLDLTIPRPR